MAKRYDSQPLNPEQQKKLELEQDLKATKLSSEITQVIVGALPSSDDDAYDYNAHQAEQEVNNLLNSSGILMAEISDTEQDGDNFRSYLVRCPDGPFFFNWVNGCELYIKRADNNTLGKELQTLRDKAQKINDAMGLIEGLIK